MDEQRPDLDKALRDLQAMEAEAQARAKQISGGAIAPLALMLLPLLPQLIDSALAIYEQIANHPTTPEATATQIRGYVTSIRAINAAIQRAPLAGDEPA